MSAVSRLSSSTMRLARVSRRQVGQVRFAHGEAEHAHHGGPAPYGVSNPVVSTGSPSHSSPTSQHLPFTYSNKKTFAVKYLTFCLTGFSLPFIATGYQL